MKKIIQYLILISLFYPPLLALAAMSCKDYISKYGGDVSSCIASTKTTSSTNKKVIQTPVVTTAPNVLSVTSFNVNIKYGSTGSAVQQLQDFLQDQGFYKGNIDSKFGLGTMRAVMAFQKANGLSVDGYFGKISRSKANSILNDVLKASKEAEQKEIKN